jgi:hypothetical protein
VDLVGADAWIRDHVEPIGGIETEHERPWATVLRVPLAGGVAGSRRAFALAMRVGAVAHAIAWLRQRDHLSAMERTEFDRGFRIVVRRAIAQAL